MIIHFITLVAPGLVRATMYSYKPVIEGNRQLLLQTFRCVMYKKTTTPS